MTLPTDPLSRLPLLEQTSSVSYSFAMPFGKTKEKLTEQVKDAAQKISTNIMTVLGIAIVAVCLAAGALICSLKALRTVRA